MRQIIKLAVVIAAVLMVAACAARPIHVDEMKDSNVGMIYGRVRMPNEDWNIVQLVMIQRIGKVYAGMGLRGVSEDVQCTPDGRYVVANLTPGKYMLAGFVIGSDRNFMGKSALNYTVEVKPGGIHYLGTYNYVPKKASNMFSPGTFELEPDQSKASHAEILTWVEETTRETKWHAGVQKRLADIGKAFPKKK